MRGILKFFLLSVLLFALVSASTTITVNEGVIEFSEGDGPDGRILAFISNEGGNTVTSEDEDVIYDQVKDKSRYLAETSGLDEAEKEEKIRENIRATPIETLREDVSDTYLENVPPQAKRFTAEMKDNLEQLKSFSSANGASYSVEFTDFEGLEVFTGRAEILENGEEFLVLREGYTLEGSGEALLVRGKSVTEGNQLTVDGGNYIISDGTIAISGDKGERLIQVISGDIGTFTSPDGREYKNIGNGEFSLNKDGLINRADFQSSGSGNYKFGDLSNPITFSVGKDARVVYDPNNKIVELYGKGDISLDDGKHEFTSLEKVSISLDDNGEINSASLSEGSEYKHDLERIFSSTSGNDYNVYFGRPSDDFESLEGDAIYIDEFDIVMKGMVKIDPIKGGLGYESLGDTTVTAFSIIDGHFDVEKGGAILTNGLHSVTLEDGKVKLGTEKLFLEDPDRLTFSYTAEDGTLFEGGLLDGTNGEFGEFRLAKDGIKLPTVHLRQQQDFSITDTELLNPRFGLSGKELISTDLDSIEEELSLIDSGLRYASSKEDRDRLNTRKLELGIKKDRLKIQELAFRPLPKGVVLSESYTVSVRDFGGDSTDATLYQMVFLEVDAQNKVTGYRFGANRYSIDDPIPPSLRDQNKAFMRSLAANDFDLKTLDRSSFGVSLINSGIDRGNPEYVSFVADANNLISDLKILKSNPLLSNPESLDNFRNDIDFEIGNALLVSQQNSAAVSHFTDLANDGPYNDVTRMQLLTQLGTAELQAGVDPRLVNRHLSEAYAIAEDLVGEGAILPQYSRFSREQLVRGLRVAQTESGRTNSEITTTYGGGSTTLDALDIAFRPATNFALTTTENRERFLDIIHVNYDTGMLRERAYSTAIDLQDSGINLHSFTSSSAADQFRILSGISRDSIIPQDSLNSYLVEVGNNPTALRTLVENDFGPAKANEFEALSNRIYSTIGAFDDSVAYDITFRELVGQGKGLPFEYMGNEGPEDLFALTRTSGASAVDFSTTEKAILGATDVLLNPISYLGISSLARSANLGRNSAVFLGGIAEEAAKEALISAHPELLPFAFTPGSLDNLAKSSAKSSNVPSKFTNDYNMGNMRVSFQSTDPALVREAGNEFSNTMAYVTGITKPLDEGFDKSFVKITGAQIGAEMIIANPNPSKLDTIEKGLIKFKTDDFEKTTTTVTVTKKDGTYSAMHNKVDSDLFNNPNLQQNIHDFNVIDDVLPANFDDYAGREGLFTERVYEERVPLGDSGEFFTKRVFEDKPFHNVGDDVSPVYSAEHIPADQKEAVKGRLNAITTELASVSDKGVQARLIAESEYLLYHANFADRGGATIGTAYSTALQRDLGFPLRKEFVSQDQIALASDFDSYINSRSTELLEGVELADVFVIPKRTSTPDPRAALLDSVGDAALARQVNLATVNPSLSEKTIRPDYEAIDNARQTNPSSNPNSFNEFDPDETLDAILIDFDDKNDHLFPGIQETAKRVNDKLVTEVGENLEIMYPGARDPIITTPNDVAYIKGVIQKSNKRIPETTPLKHVVLKDYTIGTREKASLVRITEPGHPLFGQTVVRKEMNVKADMDQYNVIMGLGPKFKDMNPVSRRIAVNTYFEQFELLEEADGIYNKHLAPLDVEISETTGNPAIYIPAFETGVDNSFLTTLRPNSVPLGPNVRYTYLNDLLPDQMKIVNPIREQEYTTFIQDLSEQEFALYKRDMNIPHDTNKDGITYFSESTTKNGVVAREDGKFLGVYYFDMHGSIIRETPGVRREYTERIQSTLNQIDILRRSPTIQLIE
ncbi:MAG: hypothetical protein ACI83O_000708 [Patescibacteria group bacterium]|jgi:hypothetical protein